jgi:TonB-dependent receptor
MVMNLYNNRIKIVSLLIFILILAIQPFTFAQSGSLKGVVFDKDSNDPLVGANLIILGSSLGAASDLDGNFVIRNIPVGEQTIIISYIGYSSDSVKVVIVENRALGENFYLMPITIEGETVTVSAQAQGQMAAIQQQLSSDQIVNIISEKKLQELPDFNAASALSRLPGVSTTQSSGEDNKVVIRGLAPKYNAIQIDGIQLSSTGSAQIGLSSNPNSGNTSISNDRSVDLTMVSPYMIRTIAVYKSLTPDMNANSIGGTVNMELREAPEGAHWDFLYQQGYTAKSGTFGNYRIVGSGSYRFLDNKLGAYALFNAESYDRNSDNLDATYDLAGDRTTIDSITGFRPVEVNSVSFKRHIETRKRYGGNLILDYTLPEGSIKFVNMLARIQSDYTDYDQKIDYDAGRMEWQLRQGENFIDQQMHSLKFDYDFGLITTDLSASYTASSNKLDNSPLINFNQVGALQAGVTRDNVKPEDLIYLLTEFKGDTNVVLRSANLFSNNYKEDRYTYKADFEIPYNLGNSVNGFLKFGGQIFNQSNSTDQETPYLRFNGSATGTGTDIQSNLMREIKDKFGINVNDQGVLTGDSFINSDSELFDSFLEDKYGDIYFAANPELLVDILDYIIGNPDYDASNSQVSTGAQGGWYDGPYQQLTNDYSYKEDYYAAYGMAKINWSDFMLIGGVRYEKVESEYFAYNARDQRNPQGQVMYDTTSFASNEFTLPMVQIKYTPTDWMDVRYAYTETLSRPDYNAISPKFTITQDNKIYTGNPELKPAKAFNHDLNFTFHSNKIGLLTIGGFYKSLENFVYSTSYQLDLAQDAGIDHIERYTIVRNGTNVVIPQSNATVTRSFNNPFEATVKGIELDFQHRFWYLPSPFNNIVFGVNYARIESETEYPFYDVKIEVQGRDRIVTLVDSSFSGRLIDQPNHVLNGYIGYDYEGFSTRLSVRYQDNSARGNGGRYPENDSYTTENFRLDFSARQKLPWWNSELFLDVNNLTNSNTSWIQRSFEGYRGIQNYGLTANLGIRIRG